MNFITMVPLVSFLAALRILSEGRSKVKTFPRFSKNLIHRLGQNRIFNSSLLISKMCLFSRKLQKNPPGFVSTKLSQLGPLIRLSFFTAQSQMSPLISISRTFSLSKKIDERAKQQPNCFSPTSALQCAAPFCPHANHVHKHRLPEVVSVCPV